MDVTPMNPTHPPPALVNEFAEWIAARWTHGFRHRYAITARAHRAWAHWRSLHGAQTSTWWCDSLAEASTNYSWYDDGSEFLARSQELRRFIADGDVAAVHGACLGIFQWGGVARRNENRTRQWVEDRASDGSLIDRIRRAVGLLQPDCDAPLDAFDGQRLLMDSAITKVYAAADAADRVVMYDGRVGAALGLLARTMLEERSRIEVPEELSYRWGAPAAQLAARLRTRNPSRGALRFRALPLPCVNAEADRIRADLARRASQLVAAVCERLAKEHRTVSPIDVERALFMIGYDVRGTQPDSTDRALAQRSFAMQD